MEINNDVTIGSNRLYRFIRIYFSSYSKDYAMNEDMDYIKRISTFNWWFYWVYLIVNIGFWVGFEVGTLTAFESSKGILIMTFIALAFSLLQNKRLVLMVKELNDE